MRKSIDLPRAAVISVLLFFISLFLLLKNGSALYNYHHAYNISELQPFMLEEGKYVNCSVDTYLLKYFWAETDEGMKNGLYLGIYLLIFSVFLYWKSGGIHITEEGRIFAGNVKEIRGQYGREISL